ncbi:hypothetical protein H7142_03890 [Candidatus Saccharibacteria bacterium]|nr:hypothetical protein [Candidatus Saccharibacteria bacterium]
MAKVIEAIDPHAAWATMSVKTLTRIFLYGLIVGVVSFMLYVGFDRLIFEPVLCRESAALARCESKGQFAAGAAIIIGSLLGLFLLVRERVYRPILAILGVAVGLWGIYALVGALPVVLAAIVSTLVFGLAYVLFSWLVQPTSLVISLVGVVVVSALSRLAIG